MPGFFDNPTPAPQKGRFFNDQPTSAEAGTPEPSGSNWKTGFGLAGAAAALGGALLLRKPGMAAKVGENLNAARQQLMLTGLAAPKSLLGNVGAVIAEAAESRSLSPLKQFFSGDTARDFTDAWKAGKQVGPTAARSVDIPIINTPGRFMGAMDTATQRSLQRSGLTSKQSAARLFQTPLGENFGKLGEAMDSPTARYVFPFRRTPFNQFFEGLQTVKPEYPHKAVTAGYAAAGAVHGAATSDEQYPVSIPLATAAAARYGVPYGGAAIVGRMLAGGKGGGGVAGTMLPVSEYGVEQSLTDPTGPFFDPSFAKVARKF